MKEMYAPVLNLIHQAGVRVTQLQIHGDKLFLQGAVGSAEIKNRILEQIKGANPVADDVTCDLTVDSLLAPVPSPKVKTYPAALGEAPSYMAKTARCGTGASRSPSGQAGTHQ